MNHHYRLKSIFPLCGVGQFISLMALLHAVLSVGSMWVILDALLSSVIIPSHVLRGLPRGFLPATGKFNILWSQWVSSLLATCPYHLILLFLITCPILTRPIDWRRSSFFFLSHTCSVARHIHLTILISAFSICSTLDECCVLINMPTIAKNKNVYQHVMYLKPI